MLQEMILQNRNHPSIILWGVHINESADDDAFYNRTNKIAPQPCHLRRAIPSASDTIGELLETQEHFSSTPTPWNSKQARPAGLACLQYQNKCFR